MLQILYKDHHYVAINKPAGLLVHRSEIDRHETRFALQLLRDQLGAHVYPVHRLDKPTSGVLLFALSSDAAKAMASHFERGSVDKHYVAVVRGYLHEATTIDHALTYRDDDYDDRGPSVTAQHAVTMVTPLATTELPFRFGRYETMRFSLVQAQPRTGRKHQIRRHLKHISHPIIGDASYGKGDLNRWVASHLGCRRLLLAATRLQFLHPFSREDITIDAPLEPDFLHLVDELGWRSRLPAAWLRIPT